jgi:DNA-binding NarL/FixJ family response regulator
MDRTIRVALIDDQLMFSESLAGLIDADPRMHVVGTAGSGPDAQRLLADARPDVALLEVDLTRQDPFQLAADAAGRAWAKVVFLTGYLSDVFITEAFRVRAWGYLLKSEPAAALLDGIRRVYAGERCFSDSVRARLEFDSRRNRYDARSENRLNSLSTRQIEILRQLARGRSVKEVARALCISEKSVDSHKYRIMHRLEIHDRVELARYAIREGLTVP